MREAEDVVFGMMRNPPERCELAIVRILLRDVFTCIVPGTSLWQMIVERGARLDDSIPFGKGRPAGLVRRNKEIRLHAFISSTVSPKWGRQVIAETMAQVPEACGHGTECCIRQDGLQDAEDALECGRAALPPEQAMFEVHASIE